jgi:hypothetical protein
LVEEPGFQQPGSLVGAMIASMIARIGRGGLRFE